VRRIHAILPSAPHSRTSSSNNEQIFSDLYQIEVHVCTCVLYDSFNFDGTDTKASAYTFARSSRYSNLET
jgi:hypothetical protein